MNYARPTDQMIVSTDHVEMPLLMLTFQIVYDLRKLVFDGGENSMMSAAEIESYQPGRKLWWDNTDCYDTLVRRQRLTTFGMMVM